MSHYIQQVVFLLPLTFIPYLLGLKTARELSFHIAPREDDRSHLIIHKLKSLH